ncbi:MAG: signal peptidase II [Armatimonadota bacterium]
MKSKRLILFWMVMIGTIAFDQWIKAWVRGNLNQGQSWRGGPWHGVFEITLTYNKGIAFGMMQGAGLIMTPIAIIIAGVAIRTIYKNANETAWGSVALALLASGALGNLYDRVFMKHLGVTDMFLLRLSNITGGRLNDFPVFNVADSCISVAMVMLLISWSKQSADEKAEPSLAQEPGLEDSSL